MFARQRVFVSVVHVPLLQSAMRAVREQAADLRNGQLVEHQNTLHEVVSTQRSGGGRGGASIQLKLRSLANGTSKHLRLGTGEPIERAVLDTHELSIMYSSENIMALIDEQTLDQPELPLSLLPQTQRQFAADGVSVHVHYYKQQPVSASLPKRITLDVDLADAYIKGDTRTGGSKGATLSTGTTVKVPPYVESGDKVVIDTHTGEFVRRAR